MPRPLAGLMALIALAAPPPVPGQAAAALLTAAEEQFRANRLDSAAALLRRVVDAASDATTSERLNAWVRLGVIQFSSGDSTAAAAAFRAAFAIDSGLVVGGLDRIDPTLAAMFEEQKAIQMFRLAFLRPEFVSGPRLVYPRDLRQRGISGRVVVAVTIDSLGHPDSASARVEETPDAGFNAAAIEFVLGSRFRPARLSGRPVALLLRVPIDFALSAGDSARTPDGDTDTVYSCAPRCRGVDRAPRMIRTSAPTTEVVQLGPYDRVGDHGVVVLRAIVDTFGVVELGSVQIHSSTAPPWIAERQVRNLNRARFTPGVANGRKVRVLIEHRVEFRFRSATRR